MNQPLVSVIIPVYMVSDYLDRCIKSLVNQKYKDLQIILVDDGSPDNCANECDRWAKKDERITVIHKPNGGQSDARNCGINIACGEYIGYIDSDDYISVDFFEVLLSTALEYESDIVVCDYVKIYVSGEHDEYRDDLAISVFSTVEGMSALISEEPFHLHVWDKLYKREVIQDIQFDVGKIHEDVFWLYQAFGCAKRIAKINRTMYFYFQRESSTTGHYSLKRLDYLEEKKNSQHYIEKKYPELALQSKLDFFGSCMYTMQCVIKFMSGNERRQAIAIIRKYKKNCRLSFKDIKAISSSARKYYYLAKINIYMCCKLRVVMNIGD